MGFVDDRGFGGVGLTLLVLKHALLVGLVAALSRQAFSLQGRWGSFLLSSSVASFYAVCLIHLSPEGVHRLSLSRFVGVVLHDDALAITSDNLEV